MKSKKKITQKISHFEMYFSDDITEDDSNNTTSTTGLDKNEDLSCNLNFSPEFSIASSCVSFLLPCVVMIGIYVKLWFIGRGHVRNIKVDQLKYSALLLYCNDQASNQLARNVELRLHGCKLLAKVSCEYL